MALLATFLVFWVLVAFAVAFVVGGAARVERLARPLARPATHRRRSAHPGRKANKAQASAEAQRSPTPPYRVPARFAGRFVH
jgi:hypothetical protein